MGCQAGNNSIILKFYEKYNLNYFSLISIFSIIVIFQVIQRVHCSVCREALFDSEPYNNKLARLTVIKQRGGLKYASRSVFRIIQLTDSALNEAILKTGGSPPSDPQFLRRLENVILHASVCDVHIFKHLQHSVFEIDHIPNMIKAISRNYANARLGYLSKTYTTSKKGVASNVRNKATRLLIFKGI